MAILYSLLFTIEFFVVGLVIYILFCAILPDSSRGAIICVAFILELVVYAALAQLVIMANMIAINMICDFVLSLAGLLILIKNKEALIREWHACIEIVKEFPRWAFMLLVSCFAYLLLQSWLLPPSSHDALAYNLARVMLFIETASTHPDNFSYIYQVIHPVGFDILSFWFLRFYADFGTAFFSFISYCVIGIGTFTLSSRMGFTRNLSAIAALCVLTFPEIVLQSTSPKNDIPVAALAVCAIVIGYEFLQKPSALFASVMVLCAIYALSVKSYAPLFFGPFGLLIGFYFFRQNDFLPGLIKLKPGSASLVILCLAVITGGLLLNHWNQNLEKFGHFFGDEQSIESHSNKDGVIGGLANMTRYGVLIVSPPDKLGGNILLAGFDYLFDEHNEAGKAPVYIGGAFIQGMQALIPAEERTWYGITGALLVFPALMLSLIFGKGYLRLVSLSIALYYVLLAMSIAWLPWSNRFFALFFAVSAPNLAFLIEKIGRFCWFRRTTLLVCIFQFLFAALLNISKPIINVYEITYKVAGAFNMQHLANYKLKKAGIQYPGPMVFTWIHYIFDRGAYVRVYYMSDPLKLYAESVKPNDRVLILATPDSPVLPFLMVDSEVIVKLDGVHSIRDSDINEDVRRTHYDYVLYIGLDAPKDIAEENVIFNIPASLSGYTPVTLLRTQ